MPALSARCSAEAGLATASGSHPPHRNQSSTEIDDHDREPAGWTGGLGLKLLVSPHLQLLAKVGCFDSHVKESPQNHEAAAENEVLAKAFEPLGNRFRGRNRPGRLALGFVVNSPAACEL